MADESVHLVVTSPPYFDLKQYAAESPDQLGEIHDYEVFLEELDRVWRECRRVLDEIGQKANALCVECVARLLGIGKGGERGVRA